MTAEYVCGECFKPLESKDLYDTPCDEKPELGIGIPAGMYHCPDCGMMLVAGFKHPQVCKECLVKIWRNS